MSDKWELMKRIIKKDILRNEELVIDCIEQGKESGVRRFFEGQAEEARTILRAMKSAEEGEKNDAV